MKDFVPMSLDTMSGSKVKYLGMNGYEGDRVHANKFLSVDGIYTVDNVEVGDWSSVVLLAEVPGKRFNTVMFENIAD